MNLINTNYAIAKGPSFAAQLKLENKNNDLGEEQVKLLEQQAARIGTDADIIDIKVGKFWKEGGHNGGSLEWQLDNPRYSTTKYQFGAKATIGGKTTEVNEKEKVCYNTLYSDLQSYLVELQRKVSPVPIDKLPGKIEDLKKELAAIKGKTPDPEIEAARKALQAAQQRYDDLVAAKEKKSDPLKDIKAQVIKDEIGRLEKRLKQYNSAVNDK